MEQQPLKVSRETVPGKLAGAIASRLRDHQVTTIECIGAEALNQAVKACAIGRGYLVPNGQDLIVVPSFIDISGERGDTSGIRLTVSLIATT